MIMEEEAMAPVRAHQEEKASREMMSMLHRQQVKERMIRLKETQSQARLEQMKKKENFKDVVLRLKKKKPLHAVMQERFLQKESQSL